MIFFFVCLYVVNNVKKSGLWYNYSLFCLFIEGDDRKKAVEVEEDDFSGKNLKSYTLRQALNNRVFKKLFNRALLR